MHPYDKLESVLTSSHYKVEFPQKKLEGNILYN